MDDAAITKGEDGCICSRESEGTCAIRENKTSNATGTTEPRLVGWRSRAERGKVRSNVVFWGRASSPIRARSKIGARIVPSYGRPV